MTAPVLLKELAARGVVAHADGDELVLRPARSLDAEMLAEVRAHKADLMALLTAPQAPVAPEPVPPPSHGILCRDVYTPSLAYDEADRLYARGEVTAEGRDALRDYADGKVRP
jgi:hypothetical protein